MSLKKDLAYYQNLDYKVIIESVNDEFGKEYIAYCNELGKYSCYGTGKTLTEAVEKFLQDKNEFIEYLFDEQKPIPEPIIQTEEPLPNGVITLRTMPVMHAQLICQAKESTVSLNQYLNQIIGNASAVAEMKNHFDRQIQYVCDRMTANFEAFYGWMRDGIQIEKSKSDSFIRKYRTPEGEMFSSAGRK